jgi:uncharacterized membrane protein YkvA (DUF1232 family)
MAAARLREWARALKRDVVALWFAYRDPRTPLLPRLLAMGIVAYALSPIDLIPDFIPVLGFVDELILLPGAIWLTLRLIPADVLAAARERAAQWLAASNARPKSYFAAALIVLIWLAALWLAWRALREPLRALL